MSVLRPPGGDAACQSVTLSPTPCSPTPCAPEQGCHIKAGNTQAADIPQVQPVVKELGGWVFPSPVLLQPRIIINWGRTRTELRQEPRCSSLRASSRPLLSWGILGPPFQSNRWAAEVSGMGGGGLDHLADSGWPERPNLVSPEQVAQQVPGGHLRRSRSSSLIALLSRLLPAPTNI